MFPDRHGNGSFEFGHYAASANMVLGNSQMFIIGGTYPNAGDEDICDLAQTAWAQHNLFTGTAGNVGDNPNGTYWALPNTSITSNVVPNDVYNVVGGDKNGGATLLAPKSGYDTPNGGLQTLLTRKPTFVARSATRAVTTATSTPSPAPPPESSSSLSTGAIVGIAIASVVGLGFILILAWCVIRRQRHRRRRRSEEQRQESFMSEPYYGPSTVSPQSAQAPFPPPTAAPATFTPQLEDTSPRLRPAELGDFPTSPRTPQAELDVQRASSPAKSNVADDRTVLPTYRHDVDVGANTPWIYGIEYGRGEGGEVIR